MMQTYQHFLRYIMCDSDSLGVFQDIPVCLLIFANVCHDITTIPSLFSKLICKTFAQAFI